MTEYPHAGMVRAEQQYARSRYDDGDLPVDAGDTPGWMGWLAFAATIMVLMGLLYVVAGLVTLVESNYYGVSTSVLVVHQNWTTLGWTQLVLGALVIAAGVALLRGRLWARIAAVALAGIGVVENFLSIGAAPVWNTLLVGLGIVVIYVVLVHGAEIPKD